MKKLVLLLAALSIGTGSSVAASAEDKVGMRSLYNYENSFIFEENGVTFSVYPDGEFDFHIGTYTGVNAGVAIGNVGVTFNSGFNYNPYVQYDDYGAVIQVQNVPVFYDFYGRVNRIGNVNVWYRNGLAYRIGGMRIFYNGSGFYNYHSGYINAYNRVYVYRPFHAYFARPAFGFCMVYNRPYRRYYHPVRYTYYRPYHHNRRSAYARVGKSYRHTPRAERSRIYRNDSRVSVRRNGIRSSARVASNRNERTRVSTSGRTSGRTADVRKGQAVQRSLAQRGNRTVVARKSAARSGREVREGSRGRTVQRSRTVMTQKAPDRIVRSQKRSTARKAPSTVARSSNRSAGKTSVKRNTRVTKSPRTTSVSRTTTVRKKREAPSRSSARSRSNRTGRH